MSTADATTFEFAELGPEHLDGPATHLAAELLRVGIERFYTVPGSPATAVAEELHRLGAWVRDARDEKSAAEAAVGAAAVGFGAAVVVKGNGASLALEPLQNAAAHHIEAPLLLIVGDDVTSSSSTVPTDARPLADAIGMPVLELIGPTTTRAVVTTAAGTSRAINAPVLLRFTATYHQAEGVPLLRWQPGSTEPTRRAATVLGHSEHRLTKDSRWDDYAHRRRTAAIAWAGRAPRVRQSGDGRLGVVVAGALWASPVSDPLRELGLPTLVLSMLSPLPHEVVDFAAGLDEVLVLEEGESYLEQAVRNELSLRRSPCQVLGQQSLHVRPRGIRSVDELRAAMNGERVEDERPLEWKAGECAVDHPYTKLFAAIRDVRHRRTPLVCSCVGSAIGGTEWPWDIIDVALNLGGAINVAAGAADASGRQAIALIGDYGLFHSGLGGHDQVYQHQAEVLTIVLANGRSDKTGGQNTPLAATMLPHERSDLGQILRASAGDKVQHLRLEDVSEHHLLARIEEMLDDLPATLVIEVGTEVHIGTWSTKPEP